MERNICDGDGPEYQHMEWSDKTPSQLQRGKCNPPLRVQRESQWRQQHSARFQMSGTHLGNIWNLGRALCSGCSFLPTAKAASFPQRSRGGERHNSAHREKTSNICDWAVCCPRSEMLTMLCPPTHKALSRPSKALREDRTLCCHPSAGLPDSSLSRFPLALLTFIPGIYVLNTTQSPSRTPLFLANIHHNRSILLDSVRTERQAKSLQRQAKSKYLPQSILFLCLLCWWTLKWQISVTAEVC